MTNQCYNNRLMLMRKIQQLSFALVEANLYLDCHPNCQRALEYFSKHKAAYDKYVAVYEEKYGPLTAKSGACGDSWQWIQGPWPWECEAN